MVTIHKTVRGLSYCPFLDAIVDTCATYAVVDPVGTPSSYDILTEFHCDKYDEERSFVRVSQQCGMYETCDVHLDADHFMR